MAEYITCEVRRVNENLFEHDTAYNPCAVCMHCDSDDTRPPCANCVYGIVARRAANNNAGDAGEEGNNG